MGPWPLAKLRRTHSRNRRYRSSRPRGLDRLATRWLDLGARASMASGCFSARVSEGAKQLLVWTSVIESEGATKFFPPTWWFSSDLGCPFDTWTSRLLAKLFQCTLWFQMNLAMKAHYKCAQMNHHVAANYKLPWCHYMGGNYHPQMVGLLSGFTN